MNWILNPNARVMLNYSMTQFDTSFYPVDVGTVTSSSKVGDKSNALMLRTQFGIAQPLAWRIVDMAMDLAGPV
jgi:hypothetical protein